MNTSGSWLPDSTDDRNVLLALDEEMNGWTQDVWAGMQDDVTVTCVMMLVTRDCDACDSRVRVGMLLDTAVTAHPVGERAYCAYCGDVTASTIVDLRTLRMGG